MMTASASVLPSLNASTKHALDASFFARTKPSAYIINCSRGPVIDTDALVSALRNGQIAGAGLDVLEGEPSKL